MAAQKQTPWSNTRQILWAAGVFGLLLFGFVFMLDLFFGGLDLDGHKSFVAKNALGWLCDLVTASVLVYHICAARFTWNRRLWRTGFVLQIVYLVLFVAAWNTGSRTVGLPVFLPGAVPWLLYAKQNNLVRSSV